MTARDHHAENRDAAPGGAAVAPRPSAAGLAQAVATACALHRQGRLLEAEAIYASVLRVEADHFDALNNLALIRLGRGQHDEGIAMIRRGLCHRPDEPSALANLATALRRTGRIEEAVALDREILARRPGDAAAAFRLGETLLALGQAEAALDPLEQAAALRPADAAGHYVLGNALLALGRTAAAVSAYERALALRPEHAEAHNNLANALLALERPAEALAPLERALALKPDYPEAALNHGVALKALDRAGEALQSYIRALALKPDYPEAELNLGSALGALDRPEEAIPHFERALALRPGYAKAHYNLGNALQALNRHAAAIAQYQAARALEPDYAIAAWNEALCHLALGDFRHGWALYEWRWRATDLATARRELAAPLWSGQDDLAGRTILIHAEQGFGDTLQFLRYVPPVAARGAAVVLEVQVPLRRLVAGLPGIAGTVAAVIAQGEPLPPFDRHCPLLSLPLALGTELAALPPALPAPAASEDAAPGRIIMRGPAPRIGIAWAGSTLHRNDRRRSLPLAALEPLLARPGLGFVSLQHELRPGDAALLEGLPRVERPLERRGERLGDFAEAAAAIAELDLVIAVDTAMAHLAAALGKPVWILLPFAADWRWLTLRDDSPWYPSVRLFRQPAIGDWASVVAAIGRALDALPAPPPPRQHETPGLWRRTVDRLRRRTR